VKKDFDPSIKYNTSWVLNQWTELRKKT